MLKIFRGLHCFEKAAIYRTAAAGRSSMLGAEMAARDRSGGAARTFETAARARSEQWWRWKWLLEPAWTPQDCSNCCLTYDRDCLGLDAGAFKMAVRADLGATRALANLSEPASEL